MTATGIERRLQNLEPFKPGEHGRHRRSTRYTELHDALVAELGQLEPIDAALLDTAVNLMCCATRPGVSAEDCVRCSNAASRLLTGLRKARAKREPEHETLQEYIARKHAAGEAGR